MSGRSSNRREALKSLAIGGLATGLVFSKTTAIAATEIALDKVPASIVKAAHHVVKDAKWESALKNKDEDQEFFELFGKHEKGLDASVEITTEGKVTSVELQIDTQDIPKAAMTTVNSRLPGFKPESALAIYGGDDIHTLSKAELVYQLNGSAAKGRDLTVEVTPEGKITEVKREIELSEVPKAVSEALSSKAPKFKPEIVHRITRDDKVAGFLFGGAKGWIVWLSHDCKEFEIHKDE
jgi:hypothetical protein